MTRFSSVVSGFSDPDFQRIQAFRSADQQQPFHGLITQRGDVVRKQRRIFLVIVGEPLSLGVIHADAVFQAAYPNPVEGIEKYGGGGGAHRAVKPFLINVIEDVVIPNPGHFIKLETFDRGIPFVPVGLVPHEKSVTGSDPVLGAFIGTFQAYHSVNFTGVEFRRIGSQPVLSVGTWDGIIIPDHQAAAIVEGADKILPAIVIAVYGALIRAVWDEEIHDVVILRVQHGETVVNAGDEHVSMRVTGYMQIGVPQQLCRVWKRGPILAGIGIPQVYAIYVQILPGVVRFVEDGDAIFPSLGAVRILIVSPKPFAVVAVHRNGINVVRMDGTVGDGKSLPVAIQVFAGAQGTFAQGEGAERAASEPGGVIGIGGDAVDFGKADGICLDLVPGYRCCLPIGGKPRRPRCKV